MVLWLWCDGVRSGGVVWCVMWWCVVEVCGEVW